MSSWIQDFCFPLIRDPKTNTILVIRHGHRQEHDQRSFGNDLVLTDEGREASFSLGQFFCRVPIGEVHSSPILRCVQTTEELLKGANQNVPIFLSKMLGDPGPFIADSEKAGTIFLQRSLQEIAQAIVDGEKLSGIRSLHEGGHIFLNYLSEVKQFPCVMVSHDIIICLLCCFLFKSRNVKEYMPRFLDGFAITISQTQVYLYFQHHKKSLEEFEFLRSQGDAKELLKKELL